MIAVFAFLVWLHPNEEHATVVNTTTRGKDKVDKWRDIRECWPDVPYTLMRCRKLGPPQSSRAFHRNAVYRGMPELKRGDRVVVGADTGTVVGHDASANMLVLFDGDSKKYPGLTLSVHPGEMRPITNAATVL